MKTYGTIKFSTVDARQPIAGICESSNYKSADKVFDIMGECDLKKGILHGRKGGLTFSSTPAGTVVALGVRAGAELMITKDGAALAGKVLVTTSSAKWSRGQPMVMDAAAGHYPAITAETKLYRGAWALSEVAPAGGFAVRARLARFDTEDSLAGPRGYVFLALNPNKKSLAAIV